MAAPSIMIVKALNSLEEADSTDSLSEVSKCKQCTKLSEIYQTFENHSCATCFKNDSVQHISKSISIDLENLPRDQASVDYPIIDNDCCCHCHNTRNTKRLSNTSELSIYCGDDTITDTRLSLPENNLLVKSDTARLSLPGTTTTGLACQNTGIINNTCYKSGGYLSSDGMKASCASNRVSPLPISDALQSITSSEARFSFTGAISPNKSNEEICRICLDNDNPHDLIAPCKCSGSTKYAHEQCLLKWFFKSSNKSCEVCLGNVNVTSIGYKPVQEWRLPERGCDFIVYLFGLYFVIMVIFTGMITWIATQKCASPVCVTLYTVCGIALIYFFYCCGCVEYSRRYWRSLLSVNRIWRIYGREDSHKNLKFNITPKHKKKHLIVPIQTSETLKTNSDPFIININQENSSSVKYPSDVTIMHNSISTKITELESGNKKVNVCDKEGMHGTDNPLSVIDDEVNNAVE